MMSMTEDQFSVQMVRLGGVFGKKHFESEQKLEMIWHTVKDLSPMDFMGVVDTMIGTLRRAPLPSDFTEAAKGKRRSVPEVTPGLQWCQVCDEVGVMRAENVEEGVDTLIRCWCRTGRRQVWNLPINTSQISRVFTVTRMPIAWFKPDKRIQITMSSLGPLVAAYRKRVTSAEKYWAEWGEILGATFWPCNLEPKRGEPLWR